MDQENLTQLMEQAAQDAVNITQEEFNLTLDYSLVSVSLVDDVLLSFVDRYADEAKTEQAVFTLANIYGAYVGEVFKRHQPGQWLMQDEATSTVVMQCGDKTFSFAGICYERLVKDPNVSVMKYLALALGNTTNH
jgi:hypothetical protein